MTPKLHRTLGPLLLKTALAAVKRFAIFLAHLIACAPGLAAGEPEWFASIKAACAREVKSPKDQPPLPPVTSRFPAAEYDFGKMKFGWNGVGIAWDAVNGEGLFLCGHNGGMPHGTMGSRALTDEGRTWRVLKWTSPLLDPLRELALAARKPAKDDEAAHARLFTRRMMGRKNPQR